MTEPPAPDAPPPTNQRNSSAAARLRGSPDGGAMPRMETVRITAPDLARRAEVARSELSRVSSDAYLAGLMGTLGADPMGE